MPWEPYFRGVEEIMDDYGGRPHWGKRHFQTAETLAPRYPRWRTSRGAPAARPRRPVRERLHRPRPRAGGHLGWKIRRRGGWPKEALDPVGGGRRSPCGLERGGDHAGLVCARHSLQHLAPQPLRVQSGKPEGGCRPPQTST